MKTAKEILDKHIFQIDAMEEYANQFKQEWISVNDRTPEMIDKEDYSENVWATDGNNIFIMAYCYVAHEGFFWADCYMKVDGECDLCDDYDITHWMPLIIPTPPKQ